MYACIMNICFFLFSYILGIPSQIVMTFGSQLLNSRVTQLPRVGENRSPASTSIPEVYKMNFNLLNIYIKRT